MSACGGKAEDLRRPKCCMCRNHGLIVPKKGHRACPFLGCPCPKCAVIARRRGAVTSRKNLRKTRSDEQKLAEAEVVDLTVNRPPAGGPGASAGPRSTGASRSPTAGAGEPSSGLDSRVQPPPARSCFDLEQAAPLPLIPFPFVDSNICPQRFPVRGQYLPNMPWMPLPAGALPAGALPAGPLPAGALPAGPLPAGPLPAGWQPAVHYAAHTPLAYTPNYRQYFYGLPPFPQPGTLRRLLPTQQQWPPPTGQQPNHLPRNDQQATGK